MERWLQRQDAAEGERLDQLRQRFWQGADWRRQDRTLVLAARSLLWALDPLEHCPEGGVLISVDNAADQERLQAQNQLLESLRSPRILRLEPTRPEGLTEALEPGECFEWLVGRSPFQGLPPELWQRWLQELNRLVSPRAQWRLLLSGPQLGPAGALAELLAGPGGPAAASTDRPLLELLQRVSAEEPTWLMLRPTPQELTTALEALGWQVECESWEESLSLELSAAACQRWLGPGAAYRSRLETLLSPAEIATLDAGFRAQLRAVLPQRLGHQRLIAHRSGAGP
jgi:putative ATPase